MFLFVISVADSRLRCPSPHCRHIINIFCRLFTYCSYGWSCPRLVCRRHDWVRGCSLHWGLSRCRLVGTSMANVLYLRAVMVALDIISIAFELSVDSVVPVFKVTDLPCRRCVSRWPVFRISVLNGVFISLLCIVVAFRLTEVLRSACLETVHRKCTCLFLCVIQNSL